MKMHKRSAYNDHECGQVGMQLVPAPFHCCTLKWKNVTCKRCLAKRKKKK